MISFTGDLYIGDQKIKIEDIILNQLNNSNLIVTNFENVLKNNTSKKREDKASNLQFSKNSLDNYLKKVKSKIVFTLGNNHLHDLGQEGVNSTTRFLNKYDNIEITGVGLFNDVIMPIIIEDNNKKIALLCVSTDEPEVKSVLATNELKGVLDYNNSVILDVIMKYKKQVDYFIIIPHWGREYVDYPSIQQREKAYKWIDAGADLVIAHHPHVIQGKENYKGKWIFYSLGNYIFPEFYNKHGILHKWTNENNKSIMLEITFSDTMVIKETGLFYKQKINCLTKNHNSLVRLKQKSKVLDVELLPIKKYFGVWQTEYYRILKKEYSLLNKINRLFPQHKDNGRIGYFFMRLKKKIIKFWI